MTSPDTVGLVTGFTQIFSSELPVLLIKKIVSRVSPGLKFIISLKIIAKKYFLGNFLLRNFTRLQFQKRLGHMKSPELGERDVSISQRRELRNRGNE